MKSNVTHYKEAIQLFKIAKEFTTKELFDFMLKVAETNPSIFISAIKKVAKIDQNPQIEKHPVVEFFELENNENALKLINILTKKYNVHEDKLDVYHINRILDNFRTNEKIPAIKIIREMANIGLKEAKYTADEFC